MALKPSLFQTGGGEDLEVKDAYAKSELETRADNSTRVKIGDGIGSGLATLMGKQPAPASNTTTKMLERRGVDSGRIGSAIANSNISPEMEKVLIERMDGEDSNGNPTTDNSKKDSLIKTVMKLKLGDAYNLVKGTDFKDTSDLISLMNGLQDSPIADIMDLGTKFAMLEEIMIKAKKLGITDFLEDLIASIDDTKATKKWLSENLIGFFDRGDVDAVILSMDWLGPSTVISRVPDGVVRLLRNFVRTPIHPNVKDPAGALRKQWEKLKGCLYRLDSQWTTIEWNGERIPNMEPFHFASREVIMVSEQDTSYYRRFVTAKAIDRIGIQSWAIRNHRYLNLRLVS